MQPEYPLYIVSKGRYRPERRLTGRAFERMGLRYNIVVEDQEVEDYRAACDSRYATVLTLDPEYQRRYDTCDGLGNNQSKGSGPARNFVWDHAAAQGHAYQWTIDDNIMKFWRFHENLKTPAGTGAIFRAMEEFAARYTNVAMSGPQYFAFVSRKTGTIPPFVPNTRIYSCNLIRTDVPFRWRGRYNEDTILSLDILKAGWCTLLFNAFLQRKPPTMSIKGGNTDTIYVNGTLAKSQMIARVHPDVARVVWKFGRWHHHVDYSRFKHNRLIRRPDVVVPEGVNEYGMKLVTVGKAAEAVTPGLGVGHRQ